MKKAKIPAQHQNQQPGKTAFMHPKPEYIATHYRGSGKLAGKTALITGGDSGIGRAVAFAFALEGANIIIHYLNEHDDARETQKFIESIGKSCWLISKNLQTPRACESLIKKALGYSERIHILVNNAGEQHPTTNIENINTQDFLNTFKTNFFSYFFITQALLPTLKSGDIIINTASVTAYKGSDHLIDYSATKGAIISFTRSLSQNLVSQGIRVNAVAPGPVWTPLIPASFNEKEVRDFGKNVPMKRPAQPSEIAPCYVFLASEDSSYMTGQVLHPNGGVIVNS